MLCHFNEHSYTREQFRDHQCYKEQSKIDDKMQEVDTYCKIKMLLLQNSKVIDNKIGLKQAKDFCCVNKRCNLGWYD